MIPSRDTKTKILHATRCGQKKISEQKNSEQMSGFFFLTFIYALIWASLVAQPVKNPPSM